MADVRVQPDSFIAARVAKLRAAMHKAKLPALLVTGFADVSYLTGFEGDDSYLLVTPERVILLSDTRFAEQISREAPWVEAVIRTKGMWDTVGKTIKKLKVKAVGVQSEALTLAQRDHLAKQLNAIDSKLKIVPSTGLVAELREIKDAREVEIIERAIAIAEHGFETLKAHLQVGMTENEIASLLTHEMRKRGAQDASFNTIVAVGPNGSLPHYRPGQVKSAPNTPILVDWGARAGGYCSDLTRMIFIGSIPPAIREIYEVVREAQEAAIAAIKPGKKAKAVDKVARDIIAKAGYGEKFGHGLGHGVGRDIHEGISLSKLSKATLKPGMVVTVEPGIYLPGVGGVRIEDDVLVTETGYRVLSRLPKSLDSAKL